MTSWERFATSSFDPQMPAGKKQKSLKSMLELIAVRAKQRDLGYSKGSMFIVWMSWQLCLNKLKLDYFCPIYI